MKKSVKTVKFLSWKFYLQKLKKGHRLGQYDFAILFGILTPSMGSFTYYIISRAGGGGVSKCLRLITGGGGGGGGVWSLIT